MWEVSRNARGVRHLEWEGANKAVGLPGRGTKECRRLHCHVRDRGTVECSNFQLGGGIENLNPSSLLQAKKNVSFNFFWLKCRFYVNRA